MQKFVILFCILALATGLAAANWTFMVYLDGDNNLEGAGIDDMNEMESVGSNSNVNIVVQFDRIDGYDNSNGNWTGTRRFLIQHDSNPSTITSPVVQDLGEADMGNPNTLRNFVQWTLSNYPATHYCLVLWNHGSGWEKGKASGFFNDPEIDRVSRPVRGVTDNPTRHFFTLESGEGPIKAICQDETNGSILKNHDVATALSGIEMDIICSDACLQGMIEVAYEWRNNADIIIGSEETEPGDGYPYDLILGHLTGNPGMSSEQLATTIVNDYGASYSSSPDHKETQSAVRVSNLPSLMTALDNFAAAMISSGNFSAILTARGATESFDVPNNMDLWHFAHNVGGAVPSVSSSANALKTAINNAIIEEYHSTGHPNVHGLAVYCPVNASQYDGAYTTSANLDMVADHQWDEFLNQLYTGGGSSGEVVDYYEPNDVPSSAYGPLPEFVVFSSYCSSDGDSDFYTFFVGGNTNAEIYLDGPDGDEDFDLYLYNDDYDIIAYSETYTADEYIEMSLSAGQYWIEVYNYGSGSNNPYALAWAYSSGMGSQGGSGWLSYDWFYEGGPEDLGWSDADAICVYFNPPEPPYSLEGIAYYMDIGAGDGSFYPMLIDMFDWLVDPFTLLFPPEYEGWFVLEVSDVIIATDFFVGFIYNEYGDVPLIGYDDYWSGRDYFYYIDDDAFESFDVTLYIRAYLRKIGPSGVDEYLVLDNKHLPPSIHSSYPNPFNMATSIQVNIPAGLPNCSVDIYDMLGKKVCNLHQGPINGGTYHFYWNGRNESNMVMPSGNYFVTLASEKGSDTRQIIFLK
ncbi:T9SS type A sorting domain-containing protein [bacterium]|nr:T9SS type A sorting domain-containing protein [bacterium]